MRIGLIVERFAPDGGGIEHAVWMLARELADSGDEIHVIAREGRPAEGVILHAAPAPTFWQPLRVIAFSRRCASIVARERLDVVHAFSRTLRQDVFHAGGGSHAAYMAHTYGASGARLRRLSPRHAVLLALERRIFADRGQTIQCVSPMVRDDIAGRYRVAPERMVVIPCGVDDRRFDRSRWTHEAQVLRREMGAGEGDRVWLFAGSGWRRKGLETALAALAASRDTSSRLWVAGRDRTPRWLREARRRGVAERVDFLGSRDDLEVVYAAADGLLFPTRYDAFGLVCLEAAASGIPVVTSARAGAASFLGEAAEIIAEAGDARRFAEAMERLADPARRSKMGTSGRAVARQYSWKRCARDLRSLYGRIVSERP